MGRVLRFAQRMLSLGRTGTGLLVAGKVALAISQGLILVVIARLEGATAVGVYTLALAVVSPIFLFAHLRLQDVIATDDDPAAGWSLHIQLAALSGLVGVLVATGIGLVWPRSDLWLIMLPLAWAKLAESLVFACQGYWRSNGLFALVARSNIARAVLAVLGVALGTYFGGLVWGVTGMAILWTLILFVELRRVPRIWAGTHFGDITWRWWHLVPLGLVAMLLSLNQSVVRLAVDVHVGTQQLGIFAATAYIVRIGAIVAQAISESGAPALRKAGRAGDVRASYRLALRSGLRAAALGVLLLVLVILVGPAFMPLLFGAEFRPSRVLMGIVSLAGVPLFASTGLALTTVSTGRHRGYLIAVTISLIVTAGGTLALTPHWGMVGAAAGWAAGEFAKLGLMLVNLRAWAVGSPRSRVADRSRTPDGGEKLGDHETPSFPAEG